MEDNSYNILKMCFFVILFWTFYAILGFEMCMITIAACIMAIIW